MATRWSIVSGVAAAALIWGASAAQAEPVQLVLWHMEQPPHRVARVQEVIDAFNKSHPDIAVKQEPQSWGEIYAKAPAAIAAGNAPDMLFAIPDFAPILKDLGALQPVDGFVKQLDGEHHFVPSALAPYSYDGGVWAVPLYNMAMSLWYRKSVFEKAGLTPPKTWSEWQAAAEKLTADGRYGIGLPANKQLYTDQTVYDLMVNAGAADIYNPDGTLRFDNPQTVKAYDFYKDLYQFSAADAPSWTWGEAEACFASGGCGMILQFTVISTYDSQAEGDAQDLGVAPIPYADDRTDSGTIAYSNAVMILAKDEARRKAAETFIAWLLEPETYGHFLNMEPGLFLPVTADGAEAKSLWGDPLVVKYKPQIEAMIANSRNGALFGFTGGHTFPSIAAISAQNILAETLQKIVVDEMPAADAVKAGQARMQEAVR